MGTTRRDILLGLGGALVGAAAAKATDKMARPHSLPTAPQNTPPLDDTTPATQPTYTLKGKLFALGAAGQNHPQGMENTLNNSFGGAVLSEVDMATSALKQTWLPMDNAHHALPVYPDDILCIAHHGAVSLRLDGGHAIKQKFIAPEGYIYGGHGQPLPEKGVFILPIRNAHPKSLKDTGKLEVYDLKTFKLIERLDSGGIHPHEVRMLPGGKELVVTHYGDIDTHPADNPFEMTILEPKLTVYDAQTLKPIRHYVQDVNAILTHMDIGADGCVYAILNQYIKLDTKAERAEALNVLRNFLGTPDLKDFEFHEDALRRKRIAIPLPTLKIDPRTGDVEKIFIGNRQNRSQSVATNTLTGTVFATFLYTNTLLVMPKDAPARGMDMALFGIDTIRGVADIPGTPYIAVGSSYRGLAIIDVRTDTLVKYFDMQVFVPPHLSTSETV